MKLNLLRLFLPAMAALAVQAEVLVNETFTYGDGALTAVSSAVWGSHSGTAGQADVAGGKLNLTESESEDVNLTLAGAPHTAESNAVLYARFLVNFSALPSGAGAYFAHFRDTTNGFRGRVFASTNGATAGSLRLGVSSTASTATFLTNDLALNTAYTVVLKLNVATQIATLWLNPAAETDPNATSADAGAVVPISTFAFRQSLSGGAGMGTLTVDDLKVATTFAEALADSANLRKIGTLRSEVDPLNNTNNVVTTSLFEVEGTVTTHANLTTSAGAFLFYLQDDTGGIAAFWRNATFSPKAGDKVRIKGPLTFFNGLLEFAPNSNTEGHSVTLVSANNPVPEPKPFDFGLLAPENFTALEAEEGRLIVVQNVSLETGGDSLFLSKSSGYPLTSSNGPAAQPFTMFVNAGTDIVNQAIPAGPYTIIGVLGQFDATNPRDSGYQILPTRYLDVQTATKPPTIRFTNTLANLVRPGDAVTSTFTEHALRPGESISVGFSINDPLGKPVSVTLGTLPPGAQWNFGSLNGTQVNGTLTYTATADVAGSAYDISLTATNDIAAVTQVIRIYVPTAVEQQVVITEFYANPTTDTNAPNFNPLNRAELLPGGTDTSPSNRDEFVEIVNLSGEAIDLTGWMVSDALLRRAYVYPGTSGASLASSNAIVFYGGPPIGYTPQLSVAAIAAEVGPGDPFSTAGLALNDGGDTIVLRNASSNIVARVVYSGTDTSTNSSLVRFPTDHDAFVAHHSPTDRYWSPGTQPDGKAWTENQPDSDVAPSINTPPADVSVVAGNPATFTVVATGVPAPTFQWQRGTVNLDGQTAASYTLASPVLGDNGATFRVIVSNRAGSVTSAPVTLTVTEPPPEVIETDVAHLRALLDPVTLRPTNTTQLYEVRGTVTTHVNLTGAANTFFYMQDTTGGIGVFVTGRPGSTVPSAGTRVRVVGPLGHFNGLLELNLAAANAKHVVEVLPAGIIGPAPVPLSYAWPITTNGLTAASPGVADAEANEARLVRVDNVLIDTTTGTNFTSGSNVTITDAANPAHTFILRIDSRVTEIIGQPKPTGPVSLVGVLGQFVGQDPRVGGYQLLITRLPDIIPGPIAVTAALDGESVTLTWNGIAGATYSVRRATDAGATFEVIATEITAPTYTEAIADRPNAFYQVTSP